MLWWRVTTYFFEWRYPLVFSTISWKIIFFLIELSWPPSQNPIHHKWMDKLLCSQFYYIDLYYYPYDLDYYRHIESFEFGKHEFSNFILLFNDFLFDSFTLPYKFKNQTVFNTAKIPKPVVLTAQWCEVVRLRAVSWKFVWMIYSTKSIWRA